ncbi:Transcription factor IWS1 [Nosema granulosis]|uniref:Transcription factor IWS1 n=1 Tax=Nosema granulosis TaxID=83296 RepID=A0A9P6H041_9MICR|nr:Transcription factor IWS1 [Nosema granulosis]
MNDTNTDTNIDNIKNILMECVEEDNRNNRAKKPGTKKLEHLDFFIQSLLSKKLQESLIEENILGVVKMWLEPLPDRSLPNIAIRKRLIETVKVLNVDRSHLLESGIGKVIHFYSINPKEDIEVKKQALEIIQKWTRKIFKEEQ